MVKRFACSLPVIVVALLLCAGSVSAAVPGALLTVHSFATPTNFATAAASADVYEVVVRNVGSRPTDGSPVTVTDTLPAGLSVKRIGFGWSGALNENLGFLCETVGGSVRCSFPFAPLAPDETLVLTVEVNVEPAAAASLLNTASVSGGGGGEASTSVRNANGPGPVLFGFSAFSALIAGVDGAADTQAGAHPYEMTQRYDLNNTIGIGPSSEGGDTSVHDLRDIVVDLPLGFVGSALATPTCSLVALTSPEHCPPDTVVGYLRTQPGATLAVNSPLWNIAPEHGVAAEFGLVDLQDNSHVVYVGVAPTPAGYVLRATSAEIPQIILNDIILTLYGDPAERDGGITPVALFTNPAACTGEPVRTEVHMDSWQEPGRYNTDGTPDFTDPNWVSAVSESPPVTGCNLLQFNASITAQPETTAANSPSGLNVEVKVPQNETPGALATPPLRKLVVTLPAGMSIDPSAAGGLAVCSQAQIGLGNNTQPSCPRASKVGAVELSSPALPGVLVGSIYLAAQNENPFGSLLALYLVVDDPATGVLIKVPGRVDLDPVTGRLTTTFDQAPQFPFSDLKAHFFGGPRAPLATPPACGTYTTGAQLTPWSAPDSGPSASASDSFQINTGCGGGFSPVFAAGTVNNQAATFSAFTATVSRTDQDQNLAGVTVTTPPGLLGTLRGVERCPEPQASQGTCAPGSLIGHTTVAAGTGPNPFYVQGGQVFLTGPYKGAPFGLSVVVPTVAGPFNLGNVVVRAAVNVDPHTAQITVVSDPLPTILQGIPLDVRVVNVTIDRPGFTFNPTSCSPLTVNGSLTSTGGATANLSSRFQAANCQGLPFHPVFTVSTQAKTSKHNGASLTVKTTFPTGAQANIHSVAVVLPKQLPARLTTIQQACPEATFAANPASCPAGSDIGVATATTPILASAFTGPAYLVSHGGAAFPDVVIVFQGEGVTLDLVGSVNIRHGITSSDFATVPDAPISSFQLTLPEGPHSGLAAVVPAKAKGNLCAQKLTMPFTITAQNGAVLKQNLKIKVTGCAKSKKHGNRKAGRK